jgi:hypothetical protein
LGSFPAAPIASYDLDGVEFRENEKEGGYAPEDKYDPGTLDEDECRRAGIPPDPTLDWIMQGKTTLPVDYYDRFLEITDLPEGSQQEFERQRSDALAYQCALDEWLPRYETAIENPASRIFIALRERRLVASGR